MGQKKIAIIGAFGLTGTPVTHALLNTDHAITIITRNPEIAKKTFPSATVVHGDLRDPEILLKLIDGHDIIHANLSISPKTHPWNFVTVRDGLKNLLDCARIANIPHISYITPIAQPSPEQEQFEWWPFGVHASAIQSIKSSGIRHTIFHTSTVMDVIDKGPFIRNNRLIVPGIQQRGIYFVAGIDLGQQVCIALDKNISQDHDYFIQGPERLIPMVAARQFATHYPHRKLIPTLVPIWPFRIAGLFNPGFTHFERRLTAMSNFQEPFLAESTWATLGTPGITIREYAQTHASI